MVEKRMREFGLMSEGVVENVLIGYGRYLVGNEGDIGYNKYKEGTLCKRIIWEALGGYIRDLDSIWEEMRLDFNFTRSGFKNMRIVLGDSVAIHDDTIRTYKRLCQENCDGIRM
ncbi:hypothetical protein Tco_0834350 [Tanacetum coccineum]